MLIKLKQTTTNLQPLIQLLEHSQAIYRYSEAENSLMIIKHQNGLLKQLENHELVEELIPVDKPYKLAAKTRLKPQTTIELRKGLVLGGKEVVVMSGPCSVESEEQIEEAARLIRHAGGTVLRGGAFKPRTSPYEFQGHGEMGLKWLQNAAKRHHLLAITEILDIRDISLVERYTDIFQVGTRNMQNYALLKELGKTRKPVLLKRGMWATYKELLLAAEYILAGGNNEVILCERGIRTHVQETRFTMDINAIPYLKQETHLPVMADPSHGTGNASLVKDVALAAIAAGADGLLIEAHPNPTESVSDKDQAIDMTTLQEIMVQSKKIGRIVRSQYE